MTFYNSLQTNDFQKVYRPVAAIALMTGGVLTSIQPAEAGQCVTTTSYTKPHWTSRAMGQDMYGKTIWMTCY